MGSKMAVQFQFEWDEVKAAANARKHGVSFDLARTIFNDSRLVTTADIEHSQEEDRWLSIGCASNGMMLSAVYLWLEDAGTVRVRIISVRKATQTEIVQYRENL
jgi:uncharacterized protein